MATRSTIALEFADGTVGQVYCHWDGYLAHNGKILFENYTDPYKLRDLIDLGDLSVLHAELGEKHNFNDEYKDGCTFYGRDRGEDRIDARYFKDFADYRANHQYEEYEYILRTDGHWYVADHGDRYVSLEQALTVESEV
jgi:hypothetical protein